MDNSSSVASNHSRLHREQVASGERFEFGANWKNFLSNLDDNMIKRAEESLKVMLDVTNLDGKTFLDVGSGSGLFSLAARNLGAKVHSFDFDPQSVACTNHLKNIYYTFDNDWIVDEGSVLNVDYLMNLGKFDFVYSWGVLHHTGDMWNALQNIDVNVAEHGSIYIALYNDQGRASNYWLKVKRLYISTPKYLRFILFIPCFARLWGPTILRDTISLDPLRTWSAYSKNRGMSPFYDLIDWIGGFPFEVCKPDEVFSFYKSLGYQLVNLKTCGGGLGCNEFVFSKK